MRTSRQAQDGIFTATLNADQIYAGRDAPFRVEQSNPRRRDQKWISQMIH
jgi:hypothetical protein